MNEPLGLSPSLSARPLATVSDALGKLQSPNLGSAPRATYGTTTPAIARCRT
ncbi:hypothetical protein AGR8A_Cc30622 [Agrobacterium fabrum str. J-07]|nr:hypothetical protein AGR8A_Cc30622 [Agrobacterium fabrum str. J-07]